MSVDETLQLSLLDSLYDAVYLVDRNRRITFWNRAAERLTGYSREEVLGRHCFDNLLRHVDEEGTLLCHGLCPLASTLHDGESRSREIFLHHKEGHRIPVSVRVAPLRDEEGTVTGAIEIFSDNSMKEQMAERLRDLERLALLDPLTGLPNRRYVQMQLVSKMDELRRYEWPFGILLLDLDNFKRLNDTRGHVFGDRALCAVAKTLAANSRIFDVVGRWGGDEFVAILTNVTAERLAHVADRLRALVESSRLGTELVGVTVSIGTALADAEDSVESLFHKADLMLYSAKRGAGRAVPAGGDSAEVPEGHEGQEQG